MPRPRDTDWLWDRFIAGADADEGRFRQVCKEVERLEAKYPDLLDAETPSGTLDADMLAAYKALLNERRQLSEALKASLPIGQTALRQEIEAQAKLGSMVPSAEVGWAVNRVGDLFFKYIDPRYHLKLAQELKSVLSEVYLRNPGMLRAGDPMEALHDNPKNQGGTGAIEVLSPQAGHGRDPRGEALE